MKFDDDESEKKKMNTTRPTRINASGATMYSQFSRRKFFTTVP
jgi:hypothetical protein